jgi:tetraacyldisaccharide 4'-kinase
MASVLSSSSRGRLHRGMAAWTLRVWYAPASPSPAGPFLTPLLRLAGKLYGGGLDLHQRLLRSRRCRLPAYVISVGNLVAGGTGKTPFTLWLADYLWHRGLPSSILSRGYGRESGGVALVPHEGETSPNARRYGDEPLLMARKVPHTPVWVGRDRTLSGNEAISVSGAKVLLLDDGFQHLALDRDLDFVLLDAHNPFGNGCLLPLGPLREPIQNLDRAHAIILTRARDTAETRNTISMLEEHCPIKPVFVCRHRLSGFRMGMDGPDVPVDLIRSGIVVAFTGIGRPQSFFRSLRESSIQPAECIAFPDHHRYSTHDVSLLLDVLGQQGARFLVTTEKDMVRLPAEIQARTLAAGLELDFGSQTRHLHAYLDGKVSTTQMSP